jgi:hypothetical protein
MEALKQAALPWKTPAEAHRTAARFLDPVLDGVAEGKWDPAQQNWIE